MRQNGTGAYTQGFSTSHWRIIGTARESAPPICKNHQRLCRHANLRLSTTADIYPRDLLFPQNLPFSAVEAVFTSSKRVDYGISLRFDHVITQKLLDRARTDNLRDRSLNQTLYDSVRERPLAISIETKCDGGAKEARVQLATWAFAQHSKLERLIKQASSDVGEEVGKPTQIPALPMIYVSGHEWSLYIAHKQDEIMVRFLVVLCSPLTPSRPCTDQFILVEPQHC